MRAAGSFRNVEPSRGGEGRERTQPRREVGMITRRFLLSLIGAIPLLVGAAPPPLVPQPFVSGLNSPTEIAQPDDASGRLFVTEQGGTVRVIRQGQLLPTPFVTLNVAGAQNAALLRYQTW